jgi:hypothetical protein
MPATTVMLLVVVLLLVVVVVLVPAAAVVGVRPVVWVHVLDATVAVTLSLEPLVRREGIVGHRHEGSPRAVDVAQSNS